MAVEDQIEAKQRRLGAVFSDEYQFRIPVYQRPYAWGTEQTLQLLADLKDALDDGGEEPYFLGSLVLVKPREEAVSDVIDGQQRLTTLTILLAVLRDLVTHEALVADIGRVIEHPASTWDDDDKAWLRLTLRDQDAPFFADNVQRGSTAEIAHAHPENDAQRAIVTNTVALRRELTKEEWTQERLSALYKLLLKNTYLVVVTTENATSAYRIFAVMNARGLPLEPADVFKSKVIGAISPELRNAFTTLWENTETDLGRDAFTSLFGYIRFAHTKTRSRGALLSEFEAQVLKPYLPHDGGKFITDVLLPYATAYGRVIDAANGTSDLPVSVSQWLTHLGLMGNDDWVPVALWILVHVKDPTLQASLLKRLEALAAVLMLNRYYSSSRRTRYLNVLAELSADPTSVPSFEATDDEKKVARDRLDGPLYQEVKPLVRYVMLRLDGLLSGDAGAAYKNDQISIEHVLPQTPPPGSQWCRDFTPEELTRWTHALGNLLLLSHRKNSQAQNEDFNEKKRRYFQTRGGVTTFALTTKVLEVPAWTPEVVASRHEEYTRRLSEAWSLN